MNDEKQRILIVDDVAENLQVILSVFKNDYIILAATCGEKAIELASKHPQPDIILLDIMMPEMDGYEVCKYLKANDETKNIPIIFITALTESESELKGLSLGAVDYVTKPINSDLVKARVFNHLELKKHRDNLNQILKDKEEIMIAQSRNAAMGEMIGMIAHQWRQPISVVSMVANNMLLDVDLDEFDAESYKEYAQSILEQTTYLSATIDDFKNFFLPDKEKNEVELVNIVQETINLIGQSLKSNEVSLSIKNETNMKVEIISRELVQVYINVIKNAKEVLIEKREKERKIDIHISDDGENVITNICDNGGGIKEEIIDKIFDSYFSTKESKTGTGLGLYMSKVIVEKHLGGSISVENVNAGVCFKITIPIDKKETT